MKEQFAVWTRELQDDICAAIEAADGREKFVEDKWQREGGGGGVTRIIQNGAVFEKGGVNVSEVYGEVTTQIKEQLKIDGDEFFACGISLVLHPYNPVVPTVHANFRYFELYRDGNVIN